MAWSQPSRRLFRKLAVAKHVVLDYARRLVHDDERPLLARLDQRIIDLRTELGATQELKD